MAGPAPFGVLRLDGKAASNLTQCGLPDVNVKLPTQGRKGRPAGRAQGQQARAAILDNDDFRTGRADRETDPSVQTRRSPPCRTSPIPATRQTDSGAPEPKQARLHKAKAAQAASLKVEPRRKVRPGAEGAVRRQWLAAFLSFPARETRQASNRKGRVSRAEAEIGWAWRQLGPRVGAP